MAGSEKITDKQIEQALIEASGHPTHAAKALNVSYPALFKRIRRNPDLANIQKATRSKTFIELTHLTEFAIKTGYMRKHVLDHNGNMTNETILVEIDDRTRMDAAFKMMAMFKGDEDIVDTIKVVGNGTVDIDKWLSINSVVLEIAPHEELDDDSDSE